MHGGVGVFDIVHRCKVPVVLHNSDDVRCNGGNDIVNRVNEEDMNNEICTYELKCKRCGKLTEIFFCNKGDFDNNKITKFASEKIQYATLEDCSNCGIKTVQEVVSFNY